MNEFSEDKLIEQTAVKIFGELWGAKNFINAYSDEGDALLGRENQGQVVFTQSLETCSRKTQSGCSARGDCSSSDGTYTRPVYCEHGQCQP